MRSAPSSKWAWVEPMEGSAHVRFPGRSVNHGLTLLQSREYKCPCQHFDAYDRDGKPA
jgi:hypothetical protein